MNNGRPEPELHNAPDTKSPQLESRHGFKGRSMGCVRLEVLLCNWGIPGASLNTSFLQGPQGLRYSGRCAGFGFPPESPNKRQLGAARLCLVSDQTPAKAVK